MEEQLAMEKEMINSLNKITNEVKTQLDKTEKEDTDIRLELFCGGIAEKKEILHHQLDFIASKRKALQSILYVIMEAGK